MTMTKTAITTGITGGYGRLIGGFMLRAKNDAISVILA